MTYSVLPHEFSILHINNYLGIPHSPSYGEFNTLCRYVNEDKLPLHCNVKNLDLSNYGRSNTSMSSFSGELKIIHLKFDSWCSIFEPWQKEDDRGAYRYKLLSFEFQDTVYSLNNGASTIIYDKEIFGKRDDLLKFIGDLNKKNEKLLNGSHVSTEETLRKSLIQEQRLAAFNVFCGKRKAIKNLTNSEHQTVYKSFTPAMTKKNFYSELQKHDSTLFAVGLNDFFKDERVEIIFDKAARNR
jgi:hypothetical protein